jgi:hypothetical protein
MLANLKQNKMIVFTFTGSCFTFFLVGYMSFGQKPFGRQTFGYTMFGRQSNYQLAMLKQKIIPWKLIYFPLSWLHVYLSKTIWLTNIWPT